MWTGNAVVAEKPAIPWLLDGHAAEVKQTIATVRARLPAGTIVVPGHGRALRPEDLDFGIEYLGALETQVQSAVNDGLTLEGTVAKVTLPEFQGYKLFGWVHPSINVPHAYNELKAAHP